MTNMYSPEEKDLLLGLARQTLQAITSNCSPPTVDLQGLPPSLAEVRACFVTMRFRPGGLLRGCTGTLLARRPLAQEVVYMSIQTALHDPRFLPVSAPEVPMIHIEISVLTPSVPLTYNGPDDLLHKLRPEIDGVTLRLGSRRATFLPQVWESYPDPRVFLGLLCEKMGHDYDAWRHPEIQVETYQAVIMEEDH